MFALGKIKPLKQQCFEIRYLLIRNSRKDRLYICDRFRTRLVYYGKTKNENGLTVEIGIVEEMAIRLGKEIHKKCSLAQLQDLNIRIPVSSNIENRSKVLELQLLAMKLDDKT